MKIVLLFLLFSNVYLFAQISDKSDVIYLDFNQNPTSKVNASYYELKTPYKDTITKYQKFYISHDKAILIEKYYLDQNGKKQAKYESFRKDDTKVEIGYYKNDKKEGPWVLYLKRKLDTLNQDKVYLYKQSMYQNNIRNGAFKELYEDGSTQGEGSYKNNKYYGECNWFHLNGKISSLENYNDKGKLLSIEQWDENGVERLKKLKPNRDISPRKKEVQKKLEYVISKKSKEISQGAAYFDILIDKEGFFHLEQVATSIQNLEMYKSKIKKVIENLKPIEPFLYHNQPQDVHIRFDFKKSTRILGTTVRKVSKPSYR